MRQTPLFVRHMASALKVINLKGVARPVEYIGHRAEHLAIRNGVSICDASHLGEVAIEGPDAIALADRLLTNDIGGLAPGKAAYTMMCRENGHIIDDLICYRVSEDRLLLVINVPMIGEDLRWIHDHAAGYDAEVRNLSTDLAIIAVQGPLSMETMQRMTRTDVHDMPYFGCAETEIATDEMIVPCLLTRTGYTGEIGFEIIVDRDLALPVWDALMIYGRPLGLVPHGVAARESARTEAGYLLNGNDMDGETWPEEAGVSWTVRLGKDFIGRDAIVAKNDAGYDRKLVGLAIEGARTMRYGAAILADGRKVGMVTSGPVSPVLTGGTESMGLGFVPTDLARPGANVALEIEIDGKCHPARVAPRPYTRLDPAAMAETRTRSPFGLRFTPDHVWLDGDGPGSVTLGLSDPGQREHGELLHLELPEIGATLKAGEPLLRLDSYRNAATIPSPASGRVVARDDAALADPSRVNKYPYAPDGLVTIETDGAAEGTLDFDDYRAGVREARRYETWTRGKRTT